MRIEAMELLSDGNEISLDDQLDSLISFGLLVC